MAEFTPRRGLEVPEGTDLRSTFGVGPVPIRESIEALDGTVDYLESVASLRPAADSVLAGTLHRATDTGVWMVSTGAAWVKVMAGSVVAGDIADGAVTNAKIADMAVDEGKIAPGAVTTSRLADAAVTNSKIADGAVRTQHILAGAVTGAKIADGAVNAAKVASLELGVISLASGVAQAPGAHLPHALKDVTGRIHLRGAVSLPSGTSGRAVGTLPAGFRPAVINTHVQYASFQDRHSTPVTVDASGAIVATYIPNGVTVALLDLEGIGFYAT